MEDLVLEEQMNAFGDPKAVVASMGKETDIVSSILAFCEFGKKTETLTQDNMKYYVNEYWTSGQRKSHSLHEISYRACFKAQLPEFFISRLTKPGECVLDPFMGRGTTLLQAALMGRNSIGNDINPLSSLLLEPRLNPISISSVARAIDDLPLTDGEIRDSELLAFYHPKTLWQLDNLRTFFNETLSPTDYLDLPEYGWVRMICLNRLSGHSSGFFSGRSMPPNQAVSIRAQEKINEKLGVSPPERDIRAIIRKKTKSLLRDGSVLAKTNSTLLCGSADKLAGVGDQTVDLLVTSPPFLDIVQYAADNWLRCWFAGIDPKSVEIAMHRTEAAWQEMVRAVLVEASRVLKRDGHVAFEVGEVRQKSVLLEKLVWEAASELPFDRLGVMINDQKFTKTANCWGVLNGSKGTNTNRIVLLRKQ